MSNPIFCAVDTREPRKAVKLAEQLHGCVGGLKLGLEFFMANGAAGYKDVKDAAKGMPIFLDVKLHDIPNTVGKALEGILGLEPAFITIHTSGGPAMMQTAANAVKAVNSRTKLLGVTVLTSLDARDLAAVGQDIHTKEQVLRLGKLAKDSGLDGIVCSPEEVEVMRKALGPDFILMVPGIRPSWAAAGDQKRVMTPKQAVSAGATYLVIGRPITGDENPADAAQRILAELA